MIGSEATPTFESIHGRVLASPLVLVVDDESVIRDSLTCYLTAAGYSIITAPNGKDGIDKYLAETPDVVLIDLLMPEKDGIETIIQLKQLRPQAKIIAMSGG